MEKVYSQKAECCGCGACAAICPKKAIRMEADVGGSLYPFIDTTLCISCKRCITVCAYHHKVPKREIQTAFAMQNLNKEQLGISSSGGAFSALATQFLEDGGVVCGAVMLSDERFPKVMHQVINCIDELPLLQGSKYVQSDLTEAFPAIQQVLSEKKKVLFSGTPCQVAAVRRMFAKDEEYLFCVDLICHGTPGPQFFADYLDYLGEQNGGKVIEYTFRDKEIGWNALQGHCLICTSAENIKILLTARTDSYYCLFMDGEVYRDSCYACPFAEAKRVGDITIGDYWGVDQQDSGLLSTNGGPFEKRKGISCVLVNTNKGEELILATSSRMQLNRVDLEHITNRNPQLQHPAKHTKMRKKVLLAYEKHGYKGVEKIYKGYFVQKKIKKATRAILRRVAKIIGKR